MKRIFLAFLLVGLAVLLIPDLRQRAQPRIDESRVWLGTKLEGPMEPILTPYRTLRTETRLGQAVTLLIRDRNRGHTIPRPDEFGTYLKNNGVEPLDAWGVPLVLAQEPDSLVVISPGPDLDYNTGDDIVAKVRYRARNRRPLRR
jgi:hypothetical protein